mgnify:CR=1 FL=1|tara:strand:- start:3 stop:434 length:432 start_codon:yes stop_codon:yes gene_type:complete
MKRSELKKMIKPLVKECVQETLLSEGLLSNIVSEVAQGMGNQFLVENKEQVVPTMSNENSVQMELMETKRKEQLKEYKQQLLDQIGNDAYGGVDLFEGTKPSAPELSATQAASPLANKDPSDAGVDISGIVALGGKNWKALMG